MMTLFVHSGIEEKCKGRAVIETGIAVKVN